MTPNHSLPRNAPEAQGIASPALLDFVQHADADLRDLHSLMLVRHGHVVAEGWWAPYAPERPHMLFSLSKSFTATAVGLAVAEGRFSLDDDVLRFFPDDAPPAPGENLRAMRVRHLLSMSTGHAEDALGHLLRQGCDNWARAFLEQSVEYAPGTHFVYNSGATYMLSAIVQGVTGQTLVEYLEPRLFAPLGIENATWETCPRGINTGGWGLNATTEDIAHLGQLYLQDGVWNGARLLPEGWVAEASARHIANGDNPDSDWNQGYGFQFWRSRHGAYRGDGAFGQFCVILPEQDAVLATTAGIGDMQAVLNLVWERLLPAMQSAPLPSDPAAEATLRERLAGLRLHGPQGKNTSPVAARVSGATYRFEPNDERIESLRLDFDENDGRGVLHLGVAGAVETIVVGANGDWPEGAFSLDRDKPRPAAASGAWSDENTYVARLCYFHTPFCPTLTCRFDGNDRLMLERRVNVGFGPTERPTLTGRREVVSAP